jgi:ornithine cyclodeaminase/alanine dehydrogenase-like protein (mu-crystallin family)
MSDRLLGIAILFCVLGLHNRAASSFSLIEQRTYNSHAFRMTSTTSLSACKVGFIGCGTIAAAIATGLATVDDDDNEEPLVQSMAISRRSQTKSDALKERFPDLVTVHEDNQEILDQADIIFITVLPQQASEVLQSLKFDLERHHLVSLVVRVSS